MRAHKEDALFGVLNLTNKNSNLLLRIKEEDQMFDQRYLKEIYLNKLLKT